MSESERAPSITALPNGPYEVQNLPTLNNSRGEDLPVDEAIYLCRCGGSGNKPFCDGTHRRNGFSSQRLREEAPTSQRDAYQGRAITVLDNRTVCAHAGHCTDGLAAVWRMQTEPWIDPDGADAQAIIATVQQCPSGALSHVLDGIEHADQDRPARIMVSKDGPYRVVGGPVLSDEVTGQQPQSREHYTLCRCGQSKNKPFCDGTHWYVQFHDEKN